MTTNGDAGFDLLVAIRDRAETEALAMEREAERLVAAAAKLAQRAVALRMLHATATTMSSKPKEVPDVADQ